MKALLLSLVLAADMRAVPPPDLAAGRALFLGAPVAGAVAVIGSTRMDAARFPCASCHGRDGRGGPEGAPAIDRAIPTLHRVLATGRTAEGRRLSAAMPRYSLEEAVAAGLQLHLAGLPAAERTGVFADRVRIGTPSALHAAALRRHLGSYFLRRVEVVSDTSGVLAVIAPEGRTGDAPALFPVRPLDHDLSRGFLPAPDAIAEALAARLARDGRDSVRVVGDGPLAPLLAEHGIRIDPAARAIVVEAAAPEIPDGPAYVRAAGNAALIEDARRKGRRLTLIVEAPDLLGHAMARNVPPAEAHAEVAARILDAALRKAGRDLTRSGLLAAIDTLRFPDLGLDFTRHPRTGTDRLEFLEIGP